MRAPLMRAAALCSVLSARLGDAIPSVPSDGSSVKLVVDGQAAAVVVLPQAPSWIELEAAQELVDHVAKMSGATLPIRNESAAAAQRDTLKVFVGNVSALPDSSPPPPEGFRVWTAAVNDDTSLFIRGDDACSASWPGKSHSANNDCRRGTIFGVYELLERLGVVWLWPGPSGEAVPRRRTVSIPADLDVTDAPALLERRYRPTYGNDDLTDPGGRWSALFKSPFNWNASRVVELAAQERQWLSRMRVGSHDTPPWGSAFGGWWCASPPPSTPPSLIVSLQG